MTEPLMQYLAPPIFYPVERAGFACHSTVQPGERVRDARIRGWVAGKTRRTCLAVASGLFIPSPERLTGQPAEHEAAPDDEPERE
jgi:hypothetical protein